jgi:membrane-bound lytic murein transglycosylase B
MRIALHARTLTLGAMVAAALMLLLSAAPVSRADDFQAWVERFWPTAKSAGVTRKTYDLAFKGMTPDPKVVEAANFQPEYVKPIGEYIDRVVSDKRIETGKTKLAENKTLLDAIEKRYGVDRHVVVAIWGVESNFGTQPGDMNVIRSLATLIYTGTKAKFAKPQLIMALKILQHGDITYEAMNGSWAGAMGHTQFIPTTYQSYAVDYDGDGKRDIWNDVPDALASTASYLKVSGWRPGEGWGYEVTLPKGFNPDKASEKTSKTLAEWSKLGLVRANGAPYPRPSDKATLFAPAGTNGPAFLLLNNFRSILHYNVAPSYALAVGHLSDRLRGEGPFVHPWPTDETHLSLDERIELQRLLVAKGLMTGDPDGVIGPATLEALKTYQRANKLPVDGFPSQTLLQMLRKQG